MSNDIYGPKYCCGDFRMFESKHRRNMIQLHGVSNLRKGMTGEERILFGEIEVISWMGPINVKSTKYDNLFYSVLAAK
jgi:hypothetical protein